MKKIVAAFAFLALIGYGRHLFLQMTALDQRGAAPTPFGFILDRDTRR
jgi:hypothetical protein